MTGPARRLGPYPVATWRDHVESLLRATFVGSLALALGCDGSWGTVGIAAGAVFGWSVWLAIRAER